MEKLNATTVSEAVRLGKSREARKCGQTTIQQPGGKIGVGTYRDGGT